MVEMKSLKGDYNTLNCCSHLHHHDYAFSLGNILICLFLYIKEQWHKQWGEEKMIEKEETRFETHELISNTSLVCVSCNEPI